MKLKLKKDIVVKKGTIFYNCSEMKIESIYDDYDYTFRFDDNACARITITAENKEYFEVV